MITYQYSPTQNMHCFMIIQDSFEAYDAVDRFYDAFNEYGLDDKIAYVHRGKFFRFPNSCYLLENLEDEDLVKFMLIVSDIITKETNTEFNMEVFKPASESLLF